MYVYILYFIKKKKTIANFSITPARCNLEVTTDQHSHSLAFSIAGGS